MFITKKIDFKKVVLAALSASFVLTPLAAQAAPPDHAPAYGYRNKDERKAAKKAAKVIRDRDRDGYDDRDRDRDGDLDEEDGYDYRETPRYQKQYGYNGDNYYYGDNNSRDFRDANRNGIDDRYENNGRGGVRTTLNGIVTRDLQGRRFEIRASNGRTYVVIARNNEPLRLTRGDRVQVFGRIFDNVRTQRNNDPYNNRNDGRYNTNSFILADRVRITRNDDQNQNGSRVNFTGRVLDVRGDRELIVRAENGRTYTVRSDDRLPSRIDEGDRVSIAGRLRNGVVDANRVELTDNRNDDDRDQENVDFRGRVQSSTTIFGQQILVVRADNGTTYRVRFDEDTRFREGDRVRVRGDLRNGIVRAEDIDRI